MVLAAIRIDGQVIGNRESRAEGSCQRFEKGGLPGVVLPHKNCGSRIERHTYIPQYTEAGDAHRFYTYARARARELWHRISPR